MLRVALACSLAVLCAVGRAQAQTGECEITLRWDANTEPDLAFYTVHMGTAAGSYTSRFDVDKTRTSLAIPLPEGKTYHFAATATNSGGLRSGYSNPVSTLVACSGTTPTTRIPNRVTLATATVCREGVCGT
jgi:hypothetical protein